MAKRRKVAGLPGYSVYCCPEAKEGEQFRVYCLWTETNPVTGVPGIHRKLVKKYSRLSDCLYYIADIYRNTERKG